MGWLIDIVVGWIGSNFGAILTGLGGIVAVVFAYFSGRKSERDKGTIRTQKEIIDAQDTRRNVEDAVRRGDPDEPDSVRKRYTRD